MKKPTIKPCPFCGKDAHYYEEEGMISCVGNEGACGFYFSVEHDAEKALLKWNTRAPETITAMGNNAGKLWPAFSNFMTACANGKTVIFEGNNFIALDKNSWHNAILKVPTPPAPCTAQDKALAWLLSGDTGTSSMTLCAAMLGLKNGYASTPSDIGDFGRCYRLLEFIPEWRTQFDKVAQVYPVWAGLVKNWAKLERLYVAALKEETRRPNYCPRGKAFHRLLNKIRGVR